MWTGWELNSTRRRWKLENTTDKVWTHGTNWWISVADHTDFTLIMGQKHQICRHNHKYCTNIGNDLVIGNSFLPISSIDAAKTSFTPFTRHWYISIFSIPIISCGAVASDGGPWLQKEQQFARALPGAWLELELTVSLGAVGWSCCSHRNNPNQLAVHNRGIYFNTWAEDLWGCVCILSCNLPAHPTGQDGHRGHFSACWWSSTVCTVETQRTVSVIPHVFDSLLLSVFRGNEGTGI